MESKFINNETTEYLKSLQGSTTEVQIAQMQGQIDAVVKYLDDFETFYELELTTNKESNKDLTKRADSQDVYHRSIIFLLKDYDRRLKRLVTAVAAVGVLLAIGVVLCLVK